MTLKDWSKEHIGLLLSLSMVGENNGGGNVGNSNGCFKIRARTNAVKSTNMTTMTVRSDQRSISEFLSSAHAFSFPIKDRFTITAKLTSGAFNNYVTLFSELFDPYPSVTACHVSLLH